VLSQLNEADVGNLWVEAAAGLADPALLPALRRLHASGWDRRDVRGHLLGEAIDRVARRTAEAGVQHPDPTGADRRHDHNA
jgi:hypothetical protein